MRVIILISLCDMSFDDYIAEHLTHILIPKLGRAYTLTQQIPCIASELRAAEKVYPHILHIVEVSMRE